MVVCAVGVSAFKRVGSLPEQKVGFATCDTKYSTAQSGGGKRALDGYDTIRVEEQVRGPMLENLTENWHTIAASDDGRPLASRLRVLEALVVGGGCAPGARGARVACVARERVDGAQSLAYGARERCVQRCRRHRRRAITRDGYKRDEIVAGNRQWLCAK